MRRSVRWFVSLVWIVSAACATESDSPSPALDAGAELATDASTREAPVLGDPQPPDIHFSIIALLIEITRGFSERCPCQVEGGSFASVRECIDLVSLKPGWTDCVNRVEVPDTPRVREQLRCQIAALSQQADCLGAAMCTEEAFDECLKDTSGCEMIDLTVLNPVVLACADALTFSR